MVTDRQPIDVSIGETVTAALDRLAKLGGEGTPAMAEIAGMMESETQFRFQSETDPAGLPWKKSLRVTGYTQGSKKVAGDGGQTLTLHAYLRRSIKSNFGADFAEAGPEASGPAAIYAGVHQDGARITPRGDEGGPKALRTPFGPRGAIVIPARPYLGWNAEMERETLDILARHAADAIAGGALLS